MDKGLFRYKAVIDFVEISFKTVKSTNGFSIKRNTGLKYVEPITPGAGSATNAFSSRIYDIDKWDRYDSAIKKLKDKYVLDGEPVITCVEVSFDAYSKGASSDQMLELVAHFSHALANPVSLNRRFAKGGKRSAEALHSRSYTIRKLAGGGTIYIGDQRVDGKSMRIYYKKTDNKQLLSDEKHRARIEITLAREDCPFGNIEEAKRFNFTNLKNHFRFTQLRDGLSNFDKMIADKLPIVGERKIRRRIKGGGPRIYSRLVHPDAQLNEIVYDSLRNLTKRLNTTTSRKTR